MKNTNAPLYRSLKISTVVGELTAIASDRGVSALLWENDSLKRVPLPSRLISDPTNPLLLEVAKQLREYFSGLRKIFDLPLDPIGGTSFQKSVWRLLTEIPCGETISYGELAAKLGDSGKARAVGTANGKNPISIIIPCHRVIGRDGTLTGFAGGLAIKRKLLDLESDRVFSSRERTPPSTFTSPPSL